MDTIFLIVKGSRADAERAAHDRSIPFDFDCETAWGETHGRTQSTYWIQVAEWFLADRGPAPFPPGSLLFYRTKEEKPTPPTEAQAESLKSLI